GAVAGGSITAPAWLAKAAEKSSATRANRSIEASTESGYAPWLPESAAPVTPGPCARNTRAAPVLEALDVDLGVGLGAVRTVPVLLRGGAGLLGACLLLAVALLEVVPRA